MPRPFATVDADPQIRISTIGRRRNCMPVTERQSVVSHLSLFRCYFPFDSNSNSSFQAYSYDRRPFGFISVPKTACDYKEGLYKCLAPIRFHFTRADSSCWLFWPGADAFPSLKSPWFPAWKDQRDWQYVWWRTKLCSDGSLLEYPNETGPVRIVMISERINIFHINTFRRRWSPCNVTDCW